jgi:phthalate 4,5-cis-dihydrodiol dehydrogenase
MASLSSIYDIDTQTPVRIGVIGLGRAFVLMLPAFRQDSRLELVAACAPRAESRAAFEAEFGGRTYADIEQFCADDRIELVYVATPHEMHCEHVIAAAQAGKHVLVDKPMAISIAECQQMIDACRTADVQLIVGPSHSFDAPVMLARKLVENGEFGQVRMIHGFNYTDFLYRPRRPAELRTSEGGGVVFSQGAHQVDIVRILGGGLVREVFGVTGAWDPDRPTEGAYSTILRFENGVAASLIYSGYAHFDSDEWMDWASELGENKDPSRYGLARRRLSNDAETNSESLLKQSRTFGAANQTENITHNEHFGPLIISCDHADLRLTPDGVQIYGNDSKRFEPAPPLRFARAEIGDALVAALRHGLRPVQTGEWGMATLEVCQAILESGRTGLPVSLNHQIGLE